MNTVFILSSGILSFGAFFLIHQLVLSRRLQQFAQLRVRMLEKEEDQGHNKTTGSFSFQMEATDRRLCKVVIADVRLPGANLQVDMAENLSFDVKGIYEPLPVRSIGFSCDRTKLNRKHGRQCAVQVEGYMLFEKEQRVPFTYKVALEGRRLQQPDLLKAMV